MARPLRLELSGGVYHVTSRGDGQEDIYLSDTDREAWLEVFGQVGLASTLYKHHVSSCSLGEND